MHPTNNNIINRRLFMKKAGAASVAGLTLASMRQDANAYPGDPAKQRTVPANKTGEGDSLDEAIKDLYDTHGVNEQNAVMVGYAYDNSNYQIDSVNYVIVASGYPVRFKVITGAEVRVLKKN